MTVSHNQPSPAWYRRLLSIPTPPAPKPRPAPDRDAALALLTRLTEVDAGIPEAVRSQLFDPGSAADTTIVIWHGFTNAPSQFVAVGERLKAAGYRVLLPRMPYHGSSDRLNRDLANLTTEQLVAQVDAAVDVAAGLGQRVWVIGLSAGASMAGWAAATRPEVSRLVLAAPLVAPKGAPMPLVRLLVKFPPIVPRLYWWWDPRVKADLEGSPHAYPGFPIPGIMPYLHLSEALFDGSVPVGHQLERVVLISNPGDFAIRRDAAKDFATKVFGPRAEYSGEAGIDGSLKWMHDFVEPLSTGTGSTEQVTAILLAALGVGAPSADGVLVPPLVAEQPA